MNPKSKPKQTKTLKSQNDSVQRRTGSKRQQKAWKKAQSKNTRAEMVKMSTGDLLDIIDRSHEDSVEISDEAIDQDDDQISVTSSVRSGPSLSRELLTEMPLTLCPVCRKLYQRVKRIKVPLKDKLLDNNPKSLTCDQWILLKPWRRKQLSLCRGNLQSFSQIIHKLYVAKKDQNKNELMSGEVCSRPHLFLQRNLRRCTKKTLKEKKKNWKKRAREDSHGPRVAKQQRLLNHHRPISNDFSHDNSFQPIGNGFTDNSPGAMSYNTSSSENGDDSDVILRQRPVSVTSETDHSKVCPKRSAPKRGAGFKDLLAQLRGNNSMIIRESDSEMIPKKHQSFTGWKRS